jgi:hypothetical protein
VDLGEHRLKNLDRPVRLFQLAAPGLEAPIPAGLPVRGEASGATARDETVPEGLTSGGVHRLRPRRLTLARFCLRRAAAPSTIFVVTPWPPCLTTAVC